MADAVTRVQRLVFYGKGGIGKSTISSNVSCALAMLGRRVLHVGCDPKHDSTIALMRGEMIPTMLDRCFDRAVSADGLVSISPDGVHCVETGGPQAGVGCAGRGISLALEIFERADLLSPLRYDAAVYDLLGDVVCGGFAAPLRRGVGEKVVIVTSEEVMSLYAANNVARAITTYASNGIVCAGLVVNLRDETEDLSPVEGFAAHLNAPVLAVFRRDKAVRDAEYDRVPVSRGFPGCAFSVQIGALAALLADLDTASCTIPTPLHDEEFHRLSRLRFAVTPERRAREVAAPAVSRDPAGDGDDTRRAAFRRDLLAGVVAARRGVVPPAEALARLKASYPDLAAHLEERDLR